MARGGQGGSGNIPTGSDDGKFEFGESANPIGRGPGRDLVADQPAGDGKTVRGTSVRPGQGSMSPTPQGSPDLSALPQPGYHSEPPSGVDAQRGVDLVGPVGEAY